jgi:hypothetical protein
MVDGGQNGKGFFTGKKDVIGMSHGVRTG